MRKDLDDLPEVSDKGLGVREGTDVDVDARNNVQVDGKGMSVAPNWRDINVLRLPKRLRHLKHGCTAANTWFCWRTGTGAFQQGPFAAGLTLEPDSAKHGNIAPAAVVLLAVYRTDLAATRPDWIEDET